MFPSMSSVRQSITPEMAEWIGEQSENGRIVIMYCTFEGRQRSSDCTAGEH